MIRIYKNLSTKFLNMVNSSKPLQLKINDLFRKKTFLFNTKHCQLCDEVTQSNHFFCNDCYTDLPRSQTKCIICCLPLVLAHKRTLTHPERPKPRLICGECLTSPPSFTVTVCPFIYEFPVKQLIRQIKYSKRRFWIKPLCLVLNQELIQISEIENLSKPDLLIPIPMHKTKHKKRGYNQAELIADYLSKTTNITVSKNSLIKTRLTETQAQLNKQDRMKNLSGSFNISQKASRQSSLIGKHIALVDDVMTTKATCELASKLLLEHGAKQVDVWCLARTPKMK